MVCAQGYTQQSSSFLSPYNQRMESRRTGKAPRKIEETSLSKNRAKHTATNLSRTWRWSIMVDMRCLPSSIIGERFENPQAFMTAALISNPQAPWLLLYAQSAGSMPTVLLSICRPWLLLCSPSFSPSLRFTLEIHTIIHWDKQDRAMNNRNCGA